MAEQLSQQRQSFLDSISHFCDVLRKCADEGDIYVNHIKNATDEDFRLFSDMIKRKGSGIDDDENPKKRKRITKPKDPNAPKRPASSYILFQNEIRKELKEKHPTLTNAELLNMISDLWKKMSEDEKATYHKAVEDAKERYSQDKKAYDNRSADEVAAANTAVAEAAALKKKSRKKKSPEAAVPVAARPPPAETSQSMTSDDEESSAAGETDEEEVKEESDFDEEPPQPPAKKAKKAPTTTAASKTKKGSK